VGVIEQAGQFLITSGRWNVVVGWFNALLPGGLADRPVVLALEAYLAELRGNAPRSLRLFDLAIPELKKEGLRESLMLALVWRSGTYRLLGDYEAALCDAKAALEIADRGGGNPNLLAAITRAIGQVYYQKGELNSALEWFNQALIALQRVNDEETLARLSVDLGMTQRALGKYASAKETYQRALDTLQSTANYNWQANLLNNLGVLQSTLGEYEEAVISLEKSLNYAALSSYPRMEAYALASIGELYQILDADEEAQDAYHRSRMLAESLNDGLLLIEIDLGEAGVAGKQGDFGLANLRLEQAAQRALSSGSLAEQAACQVERGLLLIRQGQAVQAQAELEKGTAYYGASSNSVKAARAHLFLAAAFASTHEMPEAISHLEQALSLTRALGSYAFMAGLARQVKSELEKIKDLALANSEVAPFLQEVNGFDRALSKLRRRIRSKVRVVPFAGPQMHIFGLGSMKVSVEHNLIAGSDWGTIIARDLFYLLLSNPDGLTKEAIGAIFWPDVGETDMKFRFKNNMYRLRRALGQDVIVLRNDLYYFNNALDYEYDAESYQKALDAAQNAKSQAEKVEYFQTALNLYKGPFLPLVDGNWVIPERERLVMSHLEALMDLAGIYLQDQQYTRALHCCQRALAEDSCFEIAYRVIMQIYAAMGNRAAVTRQFKLCQKTLKQEINMPPSAETINLYSTLIR
jgi:two-component SAPR family response regulator